jgi:cyclophilin family peptidyl-prolyl cis-trans isomerase/HEAT repeat protein
MLMKKARLILAHTCLMLLAAYNVFAGGQDVVSDPYSRIIQLEDERSLGGGELEALLRHKLPEVRYRAALAIGRIGDKRGTAALLKALETETAPKLRLITVFALGEMEDAQAAPALLNLLERKAASVGVRARVAEALGKIASVEANTSALGREMMEKINLALIAQLPDPRLAPLPENKLLATLTITALMRLRSPSCVDPLTRQLKSSDADVRAQAANALSRVRHPINAAAPALIELGADRDINVRANSARALGLVKEAGSFEPLVKLLNDPSEQVQVSAARSLASLADRRAVAPLLAFGEKLLKQYEQGKANGAARPPQINLLLELATALGGFKDESGAPFLHRLRVATGAGAYAEIETALVRLGEKEFWSGLDEQALAPDDWRRAVTLAQAFSELGGESGSERAKAALLKMWEQAEQGKFDARVVAALLRALNRIKHPGLPAVARRQLMAKEITTRAAAANALTDLNDENFDALAAAWERSGSDTSSDARLALLNAISKYKTPRAVNLVKSSLSHPDQRLRRRAADLLRQMGVDGAEIPAVAAAAPHDQAYYSRVRRLQNKKVTVTIYTSKGAIKVEMFAKDSPMTVDNFIELAKRKYFNGIVFHRIVPNFVAQGGDPRGDGGGGPGHQIRCEINPRLYQRGTVGMALSGKDTGGSQFFFCHAPQPHLDGGYTIFGQVIAGMDAVDKLTRGDVIERIEVIER